MAEFSSRPSWYFTNDTGPIGQKYDLEFVAVHEITHGLGFGTGLINYHDVFGGQVSQGYLATLPIGILTNPKVTTSTVFSGLEPIDIYDSFIEGYKELGLQLSKFGRRNLALNSFLYELENSGEPFDAAKQMYKAATNGKLAFKDARGLSGLYSPPTYEQGSSLSHVRELEGYGENFIMVPSIESGISLKSRMENYKLDSVYGRGILDVLDNIGWSILPLTEQKSVELALDFDGQVGKLEGNARKPVLGLFMGLLALVLII